MTDEVKNVYPDETPLQDEDPDVTMPVDAA